MNNIITLFINYVQLSVTLSQQLRTIVDSVMRICFDCPKLRHTEGKSP